MSRRRPRPTSNADFRQTDWADGPWSLCFLHVDDGGPMPWPQAAEEASQLAHWLVGLNRQGLKALQGMTRATGSGAHHACPISALTPTANARLAELTGRRSGLEQLVQEELFVLTYCYRANDPRRVIGLLAERVLYPIWWDPHHLAFGGPKDRQPGGPCPDDCTHG